MKTQNRELFSQDPTRTKIPNDGVAKVVRPETEHQWAVLEWELRAFVCEGEYERRGGDIARQGQYRSQDDGEEASGSEDDREEAGGSEDGCREAGGSEDGCQEAGGSEDHRSQSDGPA